MIRDCIDVDIPLQAVELFDKTADELVDQACTRDRNNPLSQALDLALATLYRADCPSELSTQFRAFISDKVLRAGSEKPAYVTPAHLAAQTRTAVKEAYVYIPGAPDNPPAAKAFSWRGGWDQPERWLEEINERFSSYESRSQFLVTLTYPNQNNKWQRYGLVQIARGMAALNGNDRLATEPISMLDIGTSRGNGLRALGRAANVPYSVFDPIIGGTILALPDRQDDMFIMHRGYHDVLNKLLDAHLPLGKSWGIDNVPVVDIAQERRMEAGLLSVEELATPTIVAQFRKRNVIPPEDAPQVQLIKESVDATDINNVREILPHGQRVDGISILTLLYQLPPEKRRAILEVALELVADDGFIVVADHARLGEDPMDIRTQDQGWYKDRFGYTAFLLLAKDLRRGFEPVLYADTPDCKGDVALELGAHAVIPIMMLGQAA